MKKEDTTGPQVRILVVDDHESFRRFVSDTLEERPDLQIIAEAQDGIEAVRQAEALQPDMILLDIGLPGLNGIECARRIGKLAPNSRIIFLTQETSADLVHAALNLGALGYVNKLRAGADLLVAVETVMQGKQFVSSGLDGHAELNPAKPLSPKAPSN
jgi:DNA-binding NarL/FixJ family response regulator